MYKRGDIVAVDFPFTDATGSKLRPALILSNEQVALTGDVIVVMVTSRSSQPELLIEIDNALLSHPLPRQSFVKCHRLHTLHTSLIEHKVSAASPKLLSLVSKKVISLIS